MTWQGDPVGGTPLGFSASSTIGATAVGTTAVLVGSSSSFTSNGTTDKFLLNINGELFNDHANALWKQMVLDGAVSMQFVEHWSTASTWRNFSLLKVVTGLAAGNHTMQLGLSSDTACNVQGDWLITVARLA